MKSRSIVLGISILVAAATSSCDPNSPARVIKEARNALTAKGIAVGTFNPVSTYPGETNGREQVQCATVSRNDADCRVCLVVYDDADVTIRAANSKFRAAVPEGTLYFVGGKIIFVVEPSPHGSARLVQEVYDELRNLP